jgi:hypothetical protein
MPGFGWPELLLFYAGFMERWYSAGDTARRLTLNPAVTAS